MEKEVTKEEIDAIWETIFDIINNGIPMNENRILREAYGRWAQFNEED